MLGCVTLLALFGGGVFWAGQMPLAGGIVAAGVLEPSEGRRAISHPTGGVVAEVPIREGTNVAAGELLVRFDDTLVAARRRAATERKWALEAQADRLVAELDQADVITFRPGLLKSAASDAGLQALLEAERERFAAQAVALQTASQQKEIDVRRLRQQAQAISLALQSNDQAAAAVAAQLSHVEELLAQGLSRTPDALVLRRDAAELNGHRSSLVAHRLELLRKAEAAALAFDANRLSRRLDAAQELALAREALAEVVAKLAQLTHLQAQHELRAPLAGEVIDNRVTTAGSYVAPGAPLFDLVPANDPRIISTRISPQDIPAIATGQQVTVRLSGPDLRDLPAFSGNVRQISADVQAVSPDAAPSFRVEISLQPDALPSGVQRHLRQSGQPVEVIFRAADRTALAYLTGPLSGYFARTMREP